MTSKTPPTPESPLKAVNSFSCHLCDLEFAPNHIRSHLQEVHGVAHNAVGHRTTEFHLDGEDFTSWGFTWRYPGVTVSQVIIQPRRGRTMHR